MPSAVDRALDALIPENLRALSQHHWTPVDVAVRATRLLAPTGQPSTGQPRILDIGSGIGKLCLVGALSSPAMWTGVEQHEPLVGVARALARAMRVDHRTMYLHGSAFAIDWNDFDGSTSTTRSNDLSFPISSTTPAMHSSSAYRSFVWKTD